MRVIPRRARAKGLTGRRAGAADGPATGGTRACTVRRGLGSALFAPVRAANALTESGSARLRDHCGAGGGAALDCGAGGKGQGEAGLTGNPVADRRADGCANFLLPQGGGSGWGGESGLDI